MNYDKKIDNIQKELGREDAQQGLINAITSQLQLWNQDKKIPTMTNNNTTEMLKTLLSTELKRKDMSEGVKQQRLLAGLANATGRQDRFDISQKTRFLDKFRSDPILRDAQKNINQANASLRLLQSDNPAAISTLKRQLARLAGEVGVMTDRDIAAFGGSPELVEKFKQLQKEWFRGQITDNNKKYFKELLEVMIKRSSDLYESKIEEYVPDAPYYGFDPDEFRQLGKEKYDASFLPVRGVNDKSKKTINVAGIDLEVVDD